MSKAEDLEMVAADLAKIRTLESRIAELEAEKREYADNELKAVLRLEAEKARALDRLDEMYLARTELEKKQITLLSNYGRLETALRAAEKAVAEVQSLIGGLTNNSGVALQPVRDAWNVNARAITAIRAALHGEGK